MVAEVAAVGHCPCELRNRLRSCVSTSLTLLNKLKQHRWRKHCVYFHCVLQYVCIVCYCTAYSYIVIDYGSLHSSTVNVVPSLCYTRPILFLILLSFPMYCTVWTCKMSLQKGNHMDALWLAHLAYSTLFCFAYHGSEGSWRPTFPWFFIWRNISEPNI